MTALIRRTLKTGGNDNTFSDVYRVQVDEPASHFDIRNLAGIPALGSYYVHPVTGATVTSFKVTNRSVDPVQDDNRTWDVTIEFYRTDLLVARGDEKGDSLIAPWTLKSTVSLVTATVESKVATHAYARITRSEAGVYTFLDKADAPVSGDFTTDNPPDVPVLNSARDIYVPGLMRNGILATISLTTNLQTQPDLDFVAYHGTLNKLAITYGKWVIPILYGQITGLSCEPAEWQDPNKPIATRKTEYWVLRVTINIGEVPHFASIADMGYRSLVVDKTTGKKKATKITLPGGRTPTAPELLDGFGGWKGATDDVVQRTVVERLYLLDRVKDWTPIPFRAT